MEVTRKSLLTGKIKTLDLDVTEQQLSEWRDGALVQDVFQHLSVDDREFIMTGITPEEWLAVFGEDPNERDGCEG